MFTRAQNIKRIEGSQGEILDGSMQEKVLVAWISSDCFESFSLLSNVWIHQPLMPSSDVTTTQKPGRDFYWLIV